MFVRTITTLAKAVKRAATRRTLTSYGQFLRETRRHPKLRGLPIAARGRTVARMYRALSPAEKNALKSRGSKVTYEVRPRGAAAPPRKPGPFAKFVKANYGKVRKLPAGRRLKTLAALFKRSIYHA
jgi:hypothetical protein